MTLKAQIMRSQSKLSFTKKLKFCCVPSISTRKWTVSPRFGENISRSQMDTRLVFRIHKWPRTWQEKKGNPILKVGKYYDRYSPRTHKWPTSVWKVGPYQWSLEKKANQTTTKEYFTSTKISTIKPTLGRVWCLTPLITELWRQTEADGCEFEASQVYKVIVQPGIGRPCLKSQTNKEINKCRAVCRESRVSHTAMRHTQWHSHLGKSLAIKKNLHISVTLYISSTKCKHTFTHKVIQLFVEMLFIIAKK